MIRMMTYLRDVPDDDNDVDTPKRGVPDDNNPPERCA